MVTNSPQAGSTPGALHHTGTNHAKLRCAMSNKTERDFTNVSWRSTLHARMFGWCILHASHRHTAKPCPNWMLQQTSFFSMNQQNSNRVCLCGYVRSMMHIAIRIGCTVPCYAYLCTSKLLGVKRWGEGITNFQHSVCAYTENHALQCSQVIENRVLFLRNPL